jgi:hypothetical protein
MYDSIRFTNPISNIEMDTCPLCTMRQGAFFYHLSAGSRAEETLQELQGTCCIRCATGLLHSMQQVRHAEGQAVPETTSKPSTVVM